MGHAMVSGGARASIPVTGIKLGDIAEGSIVKLNENGSPVEFYVAKHNYESALNGAGRTLLVRKYGYSSMNWHNSNVNAYATSDIDTWMNGDYKSLFDNITQNAIGLTKFYYTPGNGNTSITILSRSVFILSLTEFGKSYTNANVEGSALPIASSLLIAPVNGYYQGQWTRTPYTAGTMHLMMLDQYGSVYNSTCNNTAWSRPCFTLPSGALFDEDTMLFNGKVVT